MAIEAGIISALIGAATATAVDGTVRSLQVGDKVFPNEIITTGTGGAIEIEFSDGSVMDLGRNSQVILDSETFEFEVTETGVPTPAVDVADDIEAIQQALLAGEDPTQTANPTAAGPGVQPISEGGSEAVVVDYLAPRIIPGSGFDTTGPAVNTLTPPPFDFLVEQSDDVGSEGSEGSEGSGDLAEPVNPTDTPPVADPVLTSYLFASQPDIALPNDSFVYKQFSVGGGVDDAEYGVKTPSVFEPEASLGGDDSETVESNLTFTLTAEPEFGQLYILKDNEWEELSIGNEFSTEDDLVWSATQAQFNEYTSSTPTLNYGGMNSNSSAWSGVTLKATDINGLETNIAFDQDGIGVAGGTIVAGQLEHRSDASEKITMKFDNPSIDAEITVSRLIASEKEVGQVQAWLNSVLVGTWTFTTANGTPMLNGEAVDFSIANNNLTNDPDGTYGNATFTLPDGIVFDTLEFTATDYANGRINARGDSSDYYIQSVSVKEIPEVDAKFEYTVTDDAMNVSDSVIVSITSGTDYNIPNEDDQNAPNIINGTRGADVLIGTDHDDIIMGGERNDILTGGEGKDIFVWNTGDDGLDINEVPANDIVTDFNATEGDVLDFSDILIGEESGNLTDFISITEDGSDIVIELKPDASDDVTQTVTLEGRSFADLGVGGFDSSTQQAEIINKLVQDGHVQVDS